MSYYIMIVDMWHWGDWDEHWSGGTYKTAKAAIASVKSGVDYELERAWREEAKEGKPTAEGLVDYIWTWSELPFAFGPDSKSIFDTKAYAAERATKMVATGRHIPSASPAPVASRARSRHFTKPERLIRAVLPDIAFFATVLLLLAISAAMKRH